MKILLINKFYYHRGGDCTAVFATEQLLRSKGHEIAVFSIKHPENEPSLWEKYFPENVGFSFNGTSGKRSAAIRIFHSTEVVRKFNLLLSDFKPDIVHLHNIHSYISPIVARIAHKKGIRVVWTLHDYKLVCPTYICLKDGKICEKCFNNKLNVVRHKCMKDSYIASFLACMEACYWNRKKLSKYTDLFISPSHFMKDKMIEGGYSPEQIEVLHNFLPKKMQPSVEKEDYYCYVGRLSAEKGVDTLLESAAKLDYNLKVIGGGPLLDLYKKKYRHNHIQFLGQMKPEQLYPLVQKARLLVVPSVWYENNPFSIIEALSLGTPVLGARIGGIPELIDEGINGSLFTPGDIDELTDKISKCFNLHTNAYNYEKIAGDAQNKFGPDAFYNKLIMFYDH